MKRIVTMFALVVGVMGLAGANQVHAQETSAAGPGTVAVTIIPGGATFFTESSNAKGPSFGNYGLGGAVTLNFNRWVGVEGEVSGDLGVTQNLQNSGVTSNLKSPNLLNYSGNVIVHAANRSSVTPYATTRPSSAIRGIHFAFCSSVHPTRIGSVPSATASMAVARPRSILANSADRR